MSTINQQLSTSDKILIVYALRDMLTIKRAAFEQAQVHMRRGGIDSAEFAIPDLERLIALFNGSGG